MSMFTAKKLRHWSIALLAVLALGAGGGVGWSLAHQKAQKTTAVAPDKSTPPAPKEATEDLNALHPGKNHNRQADRYAYAAQDVLRQMQGQAHPIHDKVVFLTFDDGPDAHNTPKILDILKQANVPATFFEVGRFVTPETTAILKRQIAEGHAIGSHSFSHNYASLYPNGTADAEQITSDYQASLAAFQQALGTDFQTKVFRYPGGRMSWQGIAAPDESLAKLNVYAIDWNAAVGDALPSDQQPQSVQEMIAFNEKSLGFFPDCGVRVVLMHDSEGHELTTEALSGVIQFYQEHGYHFGVLE